jgi:hypothetical protein
MKLVAYVLLKGRRDRQTIMSAIESFAASRGHEICLWYEDTTFDQEKLPTAEAALRDASNGANGMIIYALSDLFKGDYLHPKHLEPFLQPSGRKLLTVREQLEDGIPASYRRFIDQSDQ